MTPDIVVFLGPSCERQVAGELLSADYRPPAARGDLTLAVASGARIITLIDGVFFQESAVSHREILSALSRGVRVIGASSMGALRAAELDTLGMEGIGLIYSLYKDGTLVSDDEVALVYDPESFMPLSEPLINIRCTLRKARDQGVITPREEGVLLDSARSLYFPERTYPQVCSRAQARLPQETCQRFLSFAHDHAVDQKREDAIAALRWTRECAVRSGILTE
ncbi:MAG: TfuA-related McrA-glycine thioamidation protein [Methanolinea sp.]|nr:TfuA-related McrA-glycine thioamidation protein [Methanolinea sp.]